MAVIKAAASGNWSATATWTGGVVPSLNDTVYANGFTVTLDQAIDLTGSTVDTSGSFIAGQIYQIVSVGTTNFALTANCIAPGTNAGTAVAITSAVGNIFQAVNAGTATTGTARRMGALLNYVNTPLTIATGGSFTMAASYNITGAYIQAGSANCLTVSAAASSTLAGCRATGSAFTLSTRAIAFSSSGTLTLNGIVAIGGRVAGSTVANGAHAIESTSAAGTVAFTNASTLTGGSGAVTLAINNNSTGTVTVTSSTVTGGSGQTALGIENNSTGTVTLTSSTVTGGSNATAIGIENGSTGTVTITSSTVTGGSNATAYGINNFSTGTVTLTSTTVTGGSNATAYGINNQSTGPVTITGDVTASTGAGVLNASTGSVTITGTLTPTTAVHALQCTNTTGANITLSGSLIYANNGFAPTNCLKFLMNPTPTMAKVRFAKNGSTTYSDFFTADNSLGQAAITDVRFGTVYASGTLTGVAYIPSASSVAFGVPVDNTTGTATLTAADVRAALGMATANLDTQLAAIPTAITNANAVWDELMSNHTTAGTYGGRIVRATNANNELQINAQNHASANVHQFQTAVIQSVAFATSAVTLFTGAMRTELTPELTEITEVHAIHGLDIANALTVTPTSRTSGAITQAITGDGTTNTVVTRV
jgi:hypothetical protein